VVALAGVGVASLMYFGGRLPVGLTGRNRPAHDGYELLVNKYYLDHLYTGFVVGSIKGPLARGAYWCNQVVIDGVVNAAGIGSRMLGDLVYRWVDQGVVDRAVNGAGLGAEDAGRRLRVIQSGRVQQYGALLFGGATVLAFALALFAI
jgi:NADH-quinone oxidoreductase subunit L